jgi:hypothetical protein
MPDEWYLFQTDQELGPYSWEELLYYVESGVVQPEDLVWAEGLDDWTEAGQVEGLFPETLPAAYDQAEMVPLEGSMPVPVPPPLETAPAGNPLPVIFLILAFLLLAGGALAFVLNLQGSETADETGWFEPTDGYFFDDDEVMATAQSASPTGPPMYSMGQGVVPAAFSRTTPADSPPGSSDYPGGPSTPADPAAPPGGESPAPGAPPNGQTPGPGGQSPWPGGQIPWPGGQIPGPGGQSPGPGGTPPGGTVIPQHTVRDLTISYPNNSVIRTGTRVNYSFNYYTNHWGRVQIVGTPLFNGTELSNVAHSYSLSLPTGLGSGSGSFTVNSPQRMNQFRIRMSASVDRSILHERLFNINYEFRDDVTDDTPPEDTPPEDTPPEDTPPEDTPPDDTSIDTIRLNWDYGKVGVDNNNNINTIKRFPANLQNQIQSSDITRFEIISSNLPQRLSFELDLSFGRGSLRGKGTPGDYSVKCALYDSNDNRRILLDVKFTVIRENQQGAQETEEQEEDTQQPITIVADFEISPASPHIMQFVYFDPSLSYYSHGEIERYEWGLGDGRGTIRQNASESGNNIVQTYYDTPGVKQVWLRIYGAGGPSAIKWKELIISSGVIACFEFYPENITGIKVGQEIYFSADCSRGISDNRIVEYKWTFRRYHDGRSFRLEPQITNNPWLYHTFYQPGSIEATLTVSDEAGREDSVTQRFNILPINLDETE